MGVKFDFQIYSVSRFGKTQCHCIALVKVDILVFHVRRGCKSQDLDVTEHRKGSYRSTLGTLISWLLHLLRTWNLHQSVHKCYAMTEFYSRGVQKSNFAPLVWKVFFRKISFRELQWYLFFLVYPYGVGEINVWKFLTGTPPQCELQ